MSAVLYFLPYAVAAKPTNVGAPGAKAYFYAPGSSTLRAVYSTSTLTTQLSNPVIADGAGKFPPIYLDGTLTYRHVIKDKSGTELYSRDPYIPGTAPDAASLQPYQDVCEDSAASASADATTASAAASVAASAEAGVLAALGGASIGSVSLDVASRAALKLVDTSTGFKAIFDGNIWEARDYASYSALVTADTTEAIYVRSTFNTAKVWVRLLEFAAKSTWSGFGTAQTAANNYADFTASLAVLKASGLTGYGINPGSMPLRTPVGHYSINNTISVQHTLEISGQLTTAYASNGTVLELTADVHGFECLSPDANATRIKGLRIHGTAGGASKHGINQTGNLHVEDVHLKNWSGNGINADSTSGGLSGSTYRNVGVENVGWGIRFDGADSNGCLVENLQCASARFGGLFDSSGIGVTMLGGVVNSCGTEAGYATRCVYSGKGYSVAYGQEVGASTNAPSGTTANNTWWIYGSGLPTVASATAPAWTSGLTWFFCTPIGSEPADANVRTTVVGAYVESGLNPMVLSDSSTVVGGQILVPVLNQFGTPHGGYMYGDRYYMVFNNGVKTHGDILIPSGSSYYVNLIPVVGARKTGWAVDTGTAKRTANATYSGTAGAAYSQATLQALMDAVRDLSQTVKALKDDLHGTAGHGLIGT